jgi:ferritin
MGKRKINSGCITKGVTVDKRLAKAFNGQINNELSSAYIYLSMAQYFEIENLPGCSKWMQVQFGEEQGHARKMIGFLNDRGVRVQLEAIAQPPVEFKSPLEVFEETLTHEKKVTGWINDLYKLALETKDAAAQVFLQWFITEQVEEEKNATAIIDNLKRIKESGAALIMLDHALGKRGA